ncbi:MAG: thiamine pyrophosphate-dependent enzyme [Chloroflexi bacterium]|nr:thiamine pyrophosphate-dependent enzyme [Chloroflexota bacterium]
MIPATEAARIINRHRDQAVVVSTSKALREWSQVSERRDLDVDLLDCLDKAADVALGISLARPELKVLVLDSDATLRTNPSVMVTTGGAAPPNLVHFLFEDSGHRSTGGIPIPGLGGMDFASLAREAGYAAVHRFDDLEDLAISLEEILRERGPVFVAIRVFHGPDLPPYPNRTMAQSLATVRETLSAE